MGRRFGGCCTTYVLDECKKNNVSINEIYDLDIKKYCQNTEINKIKEEMKLERSKRKHYLKACQGHNSIKHGNPYENKYKYYDRIIYLIGEPFASLYSLYRRNFQKSQFNKLNNYITISEARKLSLK